MDNFNRRRVLTLAGGLAIALPAGFYAFNSLDHRSSPEGSEQAEYESPLTAEEIKLVAAMAEGIIPNTDTPGAIGAGVPAFMGMMFAEWMLPNEQAAFRKGLESYEEAAKAAFGKSFVDGSTQQQQDLLLKWDKEADKARAAGPKNMPAFAQFKTLVVIGYYTSQVGQDEELNASMYAGQNEPGGAVMMPVPMIL